MITTAMRHGWRHDAGGANDSAVAVYNADDDYDRHARERGHPEHQPAVLEATSDDVAEEQRLPASLGRRFVRRLASGLALQRRWTARVLAGRRHEQPNRYTQ